MALFGALATIGSITLAVFNVRFDRMIETAMEDRAQAAMVAEIRLNLLLYNRSILLYGTTGDPEHRDASDEALSKIGYWLNAAKLSMRQLDDLARIQAVEERLDTYIARREELLKGDLPSARQSEVATPEFEAVLTLINDYLLRAEQDQKSLQVEVNELNQLLTRISLVATILLPLAFIWMVIRVQRSIFSPLQRLEEALQAYSAGEEGVRAPVKGPTELRDMAASFNELANQLQKQRESRYEFLLGVAHDLRNPLTALKGHIALAARQLEDRAASQEDLQQRYTKVAVLVKRLDRLVADLVDRTRMEAGQFDLQLCRCNLREILEEVRALYEGSSSRHSIHVEMPPQDVYLQCDETRMSQVLINLVSNAIKYSPEGGEVVLRVRASGGEVAIEVQDWGIGIDDAHLSLIFQPFHRIHPESVPGTGLGLAVAKGLVDAQGGRIEVESTLGVGSTFRVVFPAENVTK